MSTFCMSTFTSLSASALLLGALASGAALAQQERDNAPLGEPDVPSLTTSGNSCRCDVDPRDGGACAIPLRSSLAPWIAANSPNTRLTPSPRGQYYAAPFAVAASACAGRKVSPGQLKIHWINTGTAILEWR